VLAGAGGAVLAVAGDAPVASESSGAGRCDGERMDELGAGAVVEPGVWSCPGVGAKAGDGEASNTGDGAEAGNVEGCMPQGAEDAGEACGAGGVPAALRGVVST
jgi:hypothetical protein